MCIRCSDPRSQILRAYTANLLQIVLPSIVHTVPILQYAAVRYGKYYAIVIRYRNLFMLKLVAYVNIKRTVE